MMAAEIRIGHKPGNARDCPVREEVFLDLPKTGQLERRTHIRWNFTCSWEPSQENEGPKSDQSRELLYL